MHNEEPNALGDHLEEEDDSLSHIGIIRRSGRYPWGSGANPYQRSKTFKSYLDEMRGKGMTDAEIAKTITEYANRGVTNPKDMVQFKTPDLRGTITASSEQINAANRARAFKLSEKGMSNGEIAVAMGLPRSSESTVRGWLKAGTDIKEGSVRSIANLIKEQVEDKEYLDVGKGNELFLGVSESRLRSAVALLKDEGYKLYNPRIEQLGTDSQTQTRVLTKPGTEFRDVIQALNEGRVRIIPAQSDDGGLTFRRNKPLPVSFDSKKLQVAYKEDGGEKMDGVIEIRRNVPELSLGGKRYGQVRIAVDGTHYLKGMAMYADDLPAGVNIRFNTNKSKTDPKIVAEGKLGALKVMNIDKDTGKVDPANPFGATVKPRIYVDKDGKEKQSVLNLVNEEGSWDNWSKSLASQMLSKQPLSLASRQLAETQKATMDELKLIKSLTNPVVRQKLLNEFADESDAAAVHLKAAALPRQANKVILPIKTMRVNEVYAPDFDNGTKVALVRYPHGGPFEIPTLTVNNKNLTAKRLLGNAVDAIGIHHKVAEQLSGADFDGDSVVLIDNSKGMIKSRPPLKQLENFDPKASYPAYPGMKAMTKANTQTEMGRISNLITDMTIKGAPDSEIARAVKHSMVVIDAEKHKLNYKQSYEDNGIAHLKTLYQGGPNKGASTLISRASSTKRIDKVVPRPAKDGGPIDPKTGRKVFVPAEGRDYVKIKRDKNDNPRLDKDGNVITEKKTSQSKFDEMELVTDARKLSSGTPMEDLYARHANIMKGLAEEARRESIATQLPKQNKAAKAVYAKEVASLEAKLKVAQMNAPIERRAQILGGALARNVIDRNPHYGKDDIKKVKYRMLDEARHITGASKTKIGAKDKEGRSTLTEREWEAIQSGAFSSSKLKEILANSDMDRVRDLATPRSRSSLTTGQLARAKMMADSGRSMSEIATLLGIPRSTLVDNLNS